MIQPTIKKYDSKNIFNVDETPLSGECPMVRCLWFQMRRKCKATKLINLEGEKLPMKELICFASAYGSVGYETRSAARLFQKPAFTHSNLKF